jgi:hypothetical protein
MQRDLDFIYVGTPKSGSTWLFEALREHPKAYVLPSKSSGFFETENPGPLDDYRSLLGQAPEDAKVGEIAHDAWLYPATAARLRDAFPSVRILVCLREPGDFAASMLQWWSTHTERFGSDVEQMTRDAGFRHRMDYAGCLAPFVDAFPSEQLKVMFFDELAQNPSAFLREICDFIGIDPGFKPAVLETVVNKARPPRIPALTKAVYEIGGASRRLGMGKLVEQAKRTPWIETLLYSSDAARIGPAISDAAKRERTIAQIAIPELEQLIGRVVPAAWREAGR